MLEAAPKPRFRRTALISTALAIALPAAAQGLAQTSMEPEVAVLTGTLRHPDGTPVDSGLICLKSRETGARQLLVADEIGNFELHAKPGTYDLALQTGVEQGLSVLAVELHAGQQSVGETLTRRDPHFEAVDVVHETTGGALIGHVVWSWRGVFRHPVLFTRSMLRRRS